VKSEICIYTVRYFQFNIVFPRFTFPYFYVFSVLGLLTFLAEKLGCYKSTLNCSDDVALFCEKMKYLHEPGQNFMLAHVNPPLNGSQA